VLHTYPPSSSLPPESPGPPSTAYRLGIPRPSLVNLQCNRHTHLQPPSGPRTRTISLLVPYLHTHGSFSLSFCPEPHARLAHPPVLPARHPILTHSPDGTPLLPPPPLLSFHRRLFTTRSRRPAPQASVRSSPCERPPSAHRFRHLAELFFLRERRL